MINQVKHQLFLSTIFLLTGCSGLAFESSSNGISETGEDCGSMPPSQLVLKDEDVKDITLKSSPETIGEGMINSTETVGYKFKGKSGQKLELKLTEGVCIWIIDPRNEIFQKSTLPHDGTYLIQLAAQPGMQANYSLTMGLENEPDSLSAVASTTPTPTLTPKKQLSQLEALDIVQGWYDAKPDIFGPNYQVSAVKEYTTGKLYYETVERCNDGACGGSVGWLKHYGCYYTYDFSHIKEVVSFSVKDSSATLIIKVQEKKQLSGPFAAGCGKGSSTYQRNVTYGLEKEGETWKIHDIK